MLYEVFLIYKTFNKSFVIFGLYAVVNIFQNAVKVYDTKAFDTSKIFKLCHTGNMLFPHNIHFTLV